MDDSSATRGPAPAPGRPPARSRIRRVLNTRLLIETLIVAAIIAPAAYFWYWWQVKRTADAMLERAAKLADQKDDLAAAQYYFQYLKLQPDNADVQVRLAETYDRGAKDPRSKGRALDYYYQALLVAPEEKQLELRVRLAALLMELDKFVSAEDEAREILKLKPPDPKQLKEAARQGSRLVALALYGQWRSGTLASGRSPTLVGEACGRALELDAGDVEVAGLLARSYREQPQLLGKQQQKGVFTRVFQNTPPLFNERQQAEILAAIDRGQPQLLGREQQAVYDAQRQRAADGVMDAMVAASRETTQALLARYDYRTRYRLPGTETDLAAALKSNPDDFQAALRSGDQAWRDAESGKREGAAAEEVQAHFDQARKHYEHASAISPTAETAHAKLGELLVRQGKPADALKTLRRGLEKGNKESIELNSRLADVLIAEKQLDEAGRTIDALERTVERLSPLYERDPVRHDGLLALRRSNDFLRARWLVAKRQYLEAIPLLRRVAVTRQGAAEVARSRQAWQLLGGVYVAVGQWDQAATAYEQAAALAPAVGWLRAQAAEAWAMAGRPDTAEADYDQALALGAPAENWLALARVRLQRQLRLPKKDRDWEPFHKALAEAQKAQETNPPAEPWRLALLEAEYLVARGEEKQALELYSAAEKERPDAPKLLLALAAAYEQLDRPKDADRIVKKQEGMKGQEGAACLMQARLEADRKQYDEARKTLTNGLKSLPEEMQPALRRELVQLDLRAGQTDQARQQLLALHEKEPANRDWVMRLAELAFELGKLDETEQWENELHKLEGPDGFFWRYYRARRLLAEASGPNDAKLAEASRLQAFIQNQRPSWPGTYVLQGLLAETGGKFEPAAEAYQEAIRLGERMPFVYQRLVSLLLQTNQAEEADHYLALMQAQAGSPNSYSSLESAVAARRGQIDRALEAARHRVDEHPQDKPPDPMAVLWLGQIQMAAGKTEEAEKTLTEAVKLAPPGDIRALGGLFGFYVRTKRPDKARETLQTIAKNEKLNEAQRASILAQGYELLGDKEDNKQAEANYREAARLAPDEAAARLRLVRYLLRTGSDQQGREAEQLLRGALDRWPDSSPARRMLAALLVERGGERQWQEAQRLMEGAGKDDSMPEVNRRVEAMLLMRRGGKENLDKARQILEGLVADPKRAAPADRLQLARLYEADGRLDPARQQYLKLTDRDNPSPAHLAAFAEFLLRHDLWDEADPWLKKLDGLSPDNLGAAALRARWLRGKSQPEKIEPLVELLAKSLSEKLDKDKPQQEAELALAVGSLYSTVEQYPAAERWYRRLVELAPERYGPLAVVLAQQGKIGDAIEICRNAAQSDQSARPAVTLALALLAGKPSRQDFDRADEVFKKALADHKNDVDLLSALASVRVVEQRLDEALAIFRQILTLKPADVSTLNNLATLLAEQPDKRQEALGYVDQAIQLAGPQPLLLDTKGMILVFQKKPSEAVPLLEQAAAMPQADPRYHFHLAVAYDRAGEADKARDALVAARKGKLTRRVLTPSDEQMLRELENKFGTRLD